MPRDFVQSTVFARGVENLIDPRQEVCFALANAHIARRVLQQQFQHRFPERALGKNFTRDDVGCRD
jgi:hypothetical protein